MCIRFNYFMIRVLIFYFLKVKKKLRCKKIKMNVDFIFSSCLINSLDNYKILKYLFLV